MGNSSSSRVTNINNTLLVNENEIEIVNKNLTNQVANTVINNAKTCSANINELQRITFKNVTTAGDFNLDANQKQQAAITFGCVNANQTRTDIANNMMQEMMNSIENNNSADILSKLEAQAAASQKTGFLSTSFGSSVDSDSNNTVNFTQRNTNYTNLQNIIENSIANNFTTNNISDCITKVNTNQLVEGQNITVGKNVNIAVKQDQAASLFAECIQTSDIGQKITNTVISGTGVKQENISKTVQHTDISGGATSTQINEGLSLLASFAPCFALFGGPVIGCIICCIVCCVICIVICVLVKVFSGKSDEKTIVTDENPTNGNMPDETTDDTTDQAMKGGFLYNLFTDTFSDSFNVLNKQYFNNYH